MTATKATKSLSIWAGVMIAAIAALPPSLTAIYANRVVEKKIDTVHELVNSRLTATIAKTDSLTQLVTDLRVELMARYAEAPNP